MESNPLSIVMKDFEHAKAFGAYFCADVNCPTCDLECMQAAPLELVQQAGNKAGGSIFGACRMPRGSAPCAKACRPPGLTVHRFPYCQPRPPAGRLPDVDAHGDVRRRVPARRV
jgi:hypothetical protein